MFILASNLAILNKFDESEKLHKACLEIRKLIVPINHQLICVSMNNLGNLLLTRNKLVEAEIMLNDCLEIRKQFLPKNHPDIISSINNYAVVL